MKKGVKALLSGIMAISLAACGSSSSSAATSEATSGSDSASSSAGAASASSTGTVAGFDKAANEIGVVLVVNTNLGDHAICDLSNQGLEEAAAKYGFRTKVVELAGDTTLQLPTFEEYAEDPDYDIIIAGTPNLKEAMQQAAQEYPDQTYDSAAFPAPSRLFLPSSPSPRPLSGKLFLILSRFLFLICPLLTLTGSAFEILSICSVKIFSRFLLICFAGIST